jgi:acetyl-CoA synthetase
MKYIFDIHPETDKFACMADVGWITGHTYIVYGPLCIGVTTTVFESTPVYPTASRYWDFVDKWKATHLYTAPTAIRLLRRMGEEHVKNHDLSSLRILGTVGEPINPEAWHWYNDNAGKNECAIVDTYWMTETGSHVVAPIPGAIPTKPGSATFPFFGYQLEIIDPTSGEILEGNDVEGVLVCKSPWPSIARTVYKDHKRYLETYMKPYPGYFFFGDGAARDSDGYLWIKGRVDGESILLQPARAPLSQPGRALSTFFHTHINLFHHHFTTPPSHCTSPPSASMCSSHPLRLRRRLISASRRRLDPS